LGTGAVTYVVTGGTASGCSVSGDVLSSTSAGTCLVTATKAADTNYNPTTSAPFDVTITKADQAALTVTGPSTIAFGAADATITTSGGSGLGALSFDAGSSTACSIVAGKLHVISVAGTCTVTATKAADTGYNPTTSVAFNITVAALDHITLIPASATITAGGSQAYTATGFAADGNSWDATSSITFTIDGGGSCNGALCTATVAGDHIVTGTDTVGGTILATATLHVDAAGATPTPTPMATPTPTSTPTPTPSRAATPPPTSTGVGPASDGPAGTILFLPVALVAFFGSLLLLVLRQRRRVF
jgi:hypothetical protein